MNDKVNYVNYVITLGIALVAIYIVFHMDAVKNIVIGEDGA